MEGYQTMTTGGVPIKITHFEVRESGNPKLPLTLGFYYRGPGKDHPIEGMELDVTREDARMMATLLLGGI
jgi:hypothetical protein